MEKHRLSSDKKQFSKRKTIGLKTSECDQSNATKTNFNCPFVAIEFTTTIQHATSPVHTLPGTRHHPFRTCHQLQGQQQIVVLALEHCHERQQAVVGDQQNLLARIVLGAVGTGVATRPVTANSLDSVIKAFFCLSESSDRISSTCNVESTRLNSKCTKKTQF